MIKKLTLLVGIGAGYVLGAKAGEQRYEQIKDKFAELRGTPQVQKATETLHDTAQDLTDKAKDLVTDKIEQLKSPATVDLTEARSYQTTPPAPTTLN